MYGQLQCLDPSEQLAAIILDMQYCSAYFSLASRFCIIVQDDLKKLADHQHCPQNRSLVPRAFEEEGLGTRLEATMREVNLMSAPQYGV